MMTSNIEKKKGRVQSYKENCILLLAINASLGRAVKASSDNNHYLSLRLIEEEVAEDVHVQLNYVIELRKHFLE